MGRSEVETCLVNLSSYHIFYLVTEDGVVTSKLSGSYIPCFSVYVKSLSEITQYSEVSL